MVHRASLHIALSGLASVVLLLAVIKSEVPLLSVRPFSWLVYLGRISYGLYVFHLFALAVMMKVLFVPLLGIPLSFPLRVLFVFPADSGIGGDLLQLAGATVPETKSALQSRSEVFAHLVEIFHRPDVVIQNAVGS